MLRQRFVNAVDAEFLCVSCGEVLVRPVRAACDHEYCAACIAAHPRCAADGCGEAITAERVCNASKTARLLEKLAVRCDNAPRGCDWAGPWGELAAHRQLHCDRETVRCPNAQSGCDAAMERCEVPAHAPVCEHRREQCPHCLGLHKQIALALHIARCDLVAVPCPQGCGMQTTRGNAARHIADECGATVVACPLSDLGCDVVVPRGELATHLCDAVNDHMASVVGELRRERERHAGVVAALRAEIASQKEQISLQTRIDGEPFADVVAGLRTAVAAQTEIIDRFARGSVMVVDPTGCGQFLTIGDALERCADGDTVLLRPATYTESCVVTSKNVWIRGADSATVILDVAQGVALTLRAVGARVSNVTIRGSCRVSVAVRIEETATLEDCDVTSSNLSCVAVTGGAPLLLRCAIHGSKQCGVDWKTAVGGGAIDGCEVYGNEHPNVTVGVDAVVDIRASTLRHSKLNGIWVKRGARCTVTGCEVHDNEYSNIDVTGGTCAIGASDIHRSAKCGICVADGGTVTVSAGSVHDNALPNVAVLAGSTATLTECLVRAGLTQGVVVKAGATMTIDACTIERNAGLNIAAETGGNLQYKRPATVNL
jgi:hypothetical protein